MVSWVNKKDDWLQGRIPKKKIKKVSTSQQKNNQGVVFYPIRCPECHTKNIKCYSTRPGLRYCVCRDCDYKFKAVEGDDGED